MMGTPWARLASWGLDATGHVEVRARGERHHDLFQRGVTGPLPDAVDGDLDLPGPDPDPCERVGNGHPKVIVAMDREDTVFESRHPRL